MRTKIEVVELDKQRDFCNINELEEGEYFLSDANELCIRIEDIYLSNQTDVFSNATCLNTGRSKIFTDHKLKPINKVRIEYKL